MKTAQASLAKDGTKVTLGEYGTYSELLAPAVMLCPTADSALLEEEVRSDVLAEKPNGDTLSLSYARFKICSKTLETPTLPLGDDARQLRRVAESPDEAHHVVILTSWGSMLSGQDFPKFGRMPLACLEWRLSCGVASF